MSVTFASAFDLADVVGFELTCSCGAARTGQVADTYEDAVALLETTRPACGDELCEVYGPLVETMTAVDLPSVNVTSINAAAARRPRARRRRGPRG